MAPRKFDTQRISPIVKSSQKVTPLNSADYTIQGLTDQADTSSMAAESNSNVGLSSRQLLSPAVDGFFVGHIEYYEPTLEELDDFTRAVLSRLEDNADSSGSDIAIHQSFRQFLGVVITMMTKEANRGPQ